MDVEFMRSFYQKYYENPQMEAVKDSNEYLEKRNIRYEKEAAFIERLNLAGNELLSEFEKYLDACADEADVLQELMYLMGAADRERMLRDIW